MDVYTTSFVYPRRSRHSLSSASSRDLHAHDNYPHQPSPLPDTLASDADAIQKLVILAMQLHGCHVSYFIVDQGKAYNFHITGTYQQVMLTRGLILKDCPIQVCLNFCPVKRRELTSALPLQHRSAIKVTRSEILDSPFSKPSLKPEVRRRLDDIASETLAHIAVVNSPLSLTSRTPPDGITNSGGWSGLETERVCELVITGTEDAVDLARIRLLVMLDELVSRDLFCRSVD